jgi:hypothetical protein
VRLRGSVGERLFNQNILAAPESRERPSIMAVNGRGDRDSIKAAASECIAKLGRAFGADMASPNPRQPFRIEVGGQNDARSCREVADQLCPKLAIADHRHPDYQ